MGKHGKQSKSDNSLKILLALLIVAIIVCLAFGGKQYLEDKSPVNVAEDNQKQNNVIVEDETAEHTTDEEQQTEDSEEEKTEELEEEEEQPSEEVSISGEDKAIELAKKEYGTTDGVYFRIDQVQSSNVYIVSVRDEKTTAALMWYTVDVKNETVK